MSALTQTQSVLYKILVRAEKHEFEDIQCLCQAIANASAKFKTAVNLFQAVSIIDAFALLRIPAQIDSLISQEMRDAIENDCEFDKLFEEQWDAICKLHISNNNLKKYDHLF